MAVIPNVNTHGLMALDVYNQLEDSEVKQAIKSYPKAYLLGSNGPDILFYYKVFPWQDQKLNKIIASYGNLVHTEKINEFYEQAFSIIQKIKDQQRQEILIAYLAGHFTHWALDSLAHPFIFYRSGPLKGDRPYDHYRYESMLDALMITYVKKKKLSDLKSYRFVDVSAEERRVISTFYQQLLFDVYGVVVKSGVIDEAIKSFKDILHFLYDPHNLITPWVEKLENRMAEPWAFSSHMVNSKIDAKYDVLNLAKQSWANPTDLQDQSKMSFIDLYDYAIKQSLLLLHELNEALLSKRDNFDDLLLNRAYDTGRPAGVKMKYFDNIYIK